MKFGRAPATSTRFRTRRAVYSGCRRVAAWCVASLAGACGAQREPEPACDPASAIRSCREGDDGDCAWARLHEGRGDWAAIAALLAGAPRDLDGALRTLLPAAGDGAIEDAPLPDPGPLLFEQEGFDPHPLALPIDWRADPNRNDSWRFWFQNLGWLHRFYVPEDADAGAGLAVLEDWVDRVLYEDPPLEFSWSDHALAVRLDRTAQLLDRYLADGPVLHRDALHAGAQLLLTHLYALGSDLCYTQRHNHGAFQDLAILEHVGRYPALLDGERLREIAEARLLEQVAASVTADGVHVENSPEYQAVYGELLGRAIAVFLDAGRTPPPPLVAARDRLLQAHVHLLQPNLTLPQFGDSDNRTWRPRLDGLLDEAREQAVGDPAVLDALEWVLGRGRAGSEPDESDRVFVEGGYAAFRERWTSTEPERIVTGHFRCGRLSAVHYQPDETGFEVYGHGTELVVSPGVHSYDPTDPFVAYQAGAAAHNVLVVDDDPGEPWGPSGVLAGGVEEGLAWVQGTHSLFRGLGVASLVRTFAYAKPETFVVVDHVEAQGRHEYAQHFHVHPDLSDVTVVDGRTVVATTADREGPSVAFVALEPPTAVERAPGWYFPERQVALESIDVVFRYDRYERELDLPVLVVVAGPGEGPAVPSDATYTTTTREATLQWTAGGRGRSVTVPRP